MSEKQLRELDSNQRLIGRQHAAVALVSSDGDERHRSELLLGDVRGGVAAQRRRTRVIVLSSEKARDPIPQLGLTAAAQVPDVLQ